MNRLLKRQLKKILGKKFDVLLLDKKIQELLQRVEEAYDDYDKERRLLEHTIKINTNELTEAYKTIEKHNLSLKSEVTEKTILLEQYKSAIDATMVVSKTDITGHITYVNDTFCKLSGYNQEELINHPHSMIRHPDVPSKVYKKMWETISAKKSWHGEIKNRAKDGSTYYVDAHIFPLVNHKNKITEYIAIRSNVTHRVKTKKNLEKARERAEASEKAKMQFMANMSHEIRTPMNGIVGFTELLLKSGLSAKQKQFTSLINHSTQTLLGIVNDILDFSKIESGHLTLDYVKVNPFIEFKNAISSFQTKAKKEQISLLTHIDSLIGECLTMDVLRVNQILNNLISNAIKFTPKNGTVEIVFKRIAHQEGKERIRISVQDTGIGIPQNRQKKIFNSFVQADTSTTRKFGGTGLGLTISASLCSLMGAELKVKSEVNQGSYFYFELEFKTCIAEQSLLSQLNLIPQKEYILKEEPINLKVLVAEDSDINRILINEMLQQYGIKADFAVDGVEVVQKALKQSYDVIFMDINMPKRNGVDATIEIRKAHVITPIIAITANALEGDREYYLSQGMDDYISKPIDPKKLYTALSKLSKDSQTSQFNTLETSYPTLNEEIIFNSLIQAKKKMHFNNHMMARLMNTFADNATTNIESLLIAIKKNDKKEIYAKTHALRGIALSLQFKEIVEVCEELEYGIKNGKEIDYFELSKQLEAYIDSLCACRESVIQRLKGME